MSITPLFYLKNSALAGLVGIATGTVIHSIYNYPDTRRRKLLFSTLSGCFGVSIGYAFAVIKKKNVFVCSLSTGVNFTIVPLVFLSIRQVIQTGDATPNVMKNNRTSIALNNSHILSALSGSITGLLMSLYSIKRSLKSSVLFVASGCTLALTEVDLGGQLIA
ncbi:uncharacterized protein LOC124456050 isoform X2 [Xenia sp. Carnegie-2017]|uniref:uncharacterized protein LOC124456050 isoform X2 n=1 Tax=Xenia sp. Carnegie-2017 TaxID=2897299 RepID=UPI001F042BB3|nr:uncharacterized protein LOC124456050 isoform X2 [Xenia sp. Carnegie-2017]